MAKKKVAEVEEPIAGVTEAPVEAPQVVEQPEPAKASKTEIVVKYRDHKGEETSRTFSKAVHGDDFAKLADEFKETNKSRIIEG